MSTMPAKAPSGVVLPSYSSPLQSLARELLAMFRFTGGCQWALNEYAKGSERPHAVWALLAQHFRLGELMILADVADVADAAVAMGFDVRELGPGYAPLMRLKAVQSAVEHDMTTAQKMSYRMASYFGAWWAGCLRYRMDDRYSPGNSVKPTFAQTLERAKFAESLDLNAKPSIMANEPIPKDWSVPLFYSTHRGQARYMVKEDGSGEITVRRTDVEADVLRCTFYLDPSNRLAFGVRVLDQRARVRHVFTLARMLHSMGLPFITGQNGFRRIADEVFMNDADAPQHIQDACVSLLNELGC